MTPGNIKGGELSSTSLWNWEFWPDDESDPKTSVPKK